MRVLLGEVTRRRSWRRAASSSRDGAALDYDYLIVATGARHAYFGHAEWEPYRARARRRSTTRSLIRRRVLLAFERAERETDPARRDELLTFVLVGGGPTGVELAGTLAEIARQTLRDEFRAIDTARARIVLVEAGPTILSSFPRVVRDAARASLTRLGVEVREGTRVVGIDAHGVDVQTGDGPSSASPPARWCGRRACAASPLVQTLGVPLDRAGRVLVEPDLSIAGPSRRCSWSAMRRARAHAATGRCCPASCSRRCRAPCTPRRPSCAA